MKLAGAWIRDARISAGVSQSQLLAKLDSKNPTLVSYVENGRGRLTPQFYEAWGRAVGIDPKEVARTMIGFYTPFLYEPLFGEPFKLPE